VIGICVAGFGEWPDWVTAASRPFVVRWAMKCKTFGLTGRIDYGEARQISDWSGRPRWCNGPLGELKLGSRSVDGFFEEFDG